MKEDLNHIALVGPGGRKKIIDELIAQSDAITKLNESAVTPDNENLTEEQQMQVRKNLGLYYEETSEGEKEVVSDGVAESKLSDDTPAKEDIIKLINGVGTEIDNPVITDIENGYQINDSGISAFYVLTDGDNKGIYCGSMYSLNWKLVYKGTVTTIEKIDDKFLPELPSGPEYVEVTGVPNNLMTKEQFQAAGFTDDVLRKFASGDYAGFISGGYLYPILCAHADTMSQIFIFSDSTMHLTQVLVADWMGMFTVTALKDSISMIKISGLPTSGMTRQELEAIGITYDALQQISAGNAIGFVNTAMGITTSDRYLPIDFFQDIMGTVFNIQFHSSTKKYTITNYGNTTLAPTITVESIEPIGPVEITELPTASMTTQEELDAIGLTTDAIRKAAKGLCTGLAYRNTAIFSWTLIPILSVGITDAGLDYSLIFNYGSNQYSIRCTNGTITVTVTAI